MAEILRTHILSLSDHVELIETPQSYDVDPIGGKAIPLRLGKTLRARKRPEAPIQILLNGHMDTVYAESSEFQKTYLSDDGERLHGPGVADMKGGLLVMLEALAIFEKHPEASRIGWEILIGPDEEIGSPGTDLLLKESAERNDLGLIYESSPPGGSLVRERMGGGNFLLRAHGRSVHVGKNFQDGRNAIVAISEAILEIQAAHEIFPHARFNVGHIAGGEVLNAVAENAHARFNIRYQRQEDAAAILDHLEELRARLEKKHDLSLVWHGSFSRPAREATEPTEALYRFIKETGAELEQSLPFHDTGGGSDGSNLLAYGLVNIDNLGVIGAELHSAQEYMEIASLPERIRLSALLLIRIARGQAPDLLFQNTHTSKS